MTTNDRGSNGKHTVVRLSASNWLALTALAFTIVASIVSLFARLSVLETQYNAITNSIQELRLDIREVRQAQPSEK